MAKTKKKKTKVNTKAKETGRGVGRPKISEEKRTNKVRRALVKCKACEGNKFDRIDKVKDHIKNTVLWDWMKPATETHEDYKKLDKIRKIHTDFARNNEVTKLKYDNMLDKKPMSGPMDGFVKLPLQQPGDAPVHESSSEVYVEDNRLLEEEEDDPEEEDNPEEEDEDLQDQVEDEGEGAGMQENQATGHQGGIEIESSSPAENVPMRTSYPCSSCPQIFNEEKHLVDHRKALHFYHDEEGGKGGIECERRAVIHQPQCGQFPDDSEGKSGNKYC